MRSSVAQMLNSAWFWCSLLELHLFTVSNVQCHVMDIKRDHFCKNPFFGFEDLENCSFGCGNDWLSMVIVVDKLLLNCAMPAAFLMPANSCQKTANI